MSKTNKDGMRQISLLNVIEMIFQVRDIGAVDYQKLCYILDLSKKGLDKIVDSSDRLRYSDDDDYYLYYRIEGYT